MAARRQAATKAASQTATKTATKTVPGTVAETAPNDGVQTACNEVRLRGRVAAEAEERELPSRDRLVQLRVIVPREPTRKARQRRPKVGTDEATSRRVQTIDTIDLVCWTAQTRRSASRLGAGDHVEVIGALRRRFFGGPGGRQSRYEVEVTVLRRVAERHSDDT